MTGIVFSPLLINQLPFIFLIVFLKKISLFDLSQGLFPFGSILYIQTSYPNGTEGLDGSLKMKEETTATQE